MSEHQTPAEHQQPEAENQTQAPDTHGMAVAELATLKAQITDLHDQVLRAQAEMQNTRRRADEETAKARKYAIESFAESLLPVLDSLGAGLAVDNATNEQLREGMQATERQLKGALERNKVMEVAPNGGDAFDPAKHQAISVIPSEHPENSVVTTLQKGYTIAERTLRPALVTVSAGT